MPVGVVLPYRACSCAVRLREHGGVEVNHEEGGVGGGGGGGGEGVGGSSVAAPFEASAGRGGEGRCALVALRLKGGERI